MDSVTQGALGACVGVAVLGRRIGPRRAALTGAVLGTLPDLDVFLAPEDPIQSFVQHRGWSHSLFVHAALTPVIGEGLRRLSGALGDRRMLTYWAVFLCLSTHALLDAMTIYGTRLFWPIWTEPIGLGSLFIIDPLYTIPLLAVVIRALLAGRWTARFGKTLNMCLGLSAVYLGWSAIAQQKVSGAAAALLEKHNIKPDRMIATPTPFNTLFWRVIGVDGERSFNLYIPVFDDGGKAVLHAYERNLDLVDCADVRARVGKVADFSQGFHRILVRDGTVSVADLRMGLTPNYAFRFVLGRLEGGKLTPTETRRLGGRGDTGQDIDWLLANLMGQPAVRPAEAASRVGFRQYASRNGGPAASPRC